MKAIPFPALWLAIALLPTGSGALAHGGGLDARGCHHDRKHGGTHCHGGARAAPREVAQRLAAIKRSLKRGSVQARGLFGAAQPAFANCREARAAGAAPIAIGSPGYARHLDRDNDGIGCE